MGFVERLQNFFWTVLLASVPLVPDPPDEILHQYRTYGHFETLNDLAAKSLLWILTSDFIIDYARPLMPNIIEAAGLTIRPTTSGQLPDKIKNFVDNSRQGTLVVSFGSIVSQFPREMAEKYVSAFRNLSDYNIIWRFERRDDVELPENVLPLSWIPQNELLAHPKTKLFITHCGNNGQYEALYHAIPMIGFPLGGDQPYNAKRMVYRGFGLELNIHEFTTEELLNSIRTLLTKKSFKEKISKASEIYRSSAMTARQKSVWWIEHVARFGDSHLRSAGNDLDLHQYVMIDVLLFLSVLIVLSICCLWKSVGFVFRKTLFRVATKKNKEKRQ